MDGTSKSLIAANILVIGISVVSNLNFADILWVYWFECLFVGVFSFLTLIYNQSRPAAKSAPMSPIMMALFFILPYLLFHAGYLIILLSIRQFAFNPITVLACSALLLTSHAYSFYDNVIRRPFIPDGGKDWVHSAFKSPYQRILPMHAMMIALAFMQLFGSQIIGNPRYDMILMIALMGAKTYFDLRSHVLKNGLAV